MIAATMMRPGDTVRDKHLGLLWAVIANERDGIVVIERNGVRISATRWDLEVITVTQHA